MREYRARRRHGIMITSGYAIGPDWLDLLIDAGLLEPRHRFNADEVSDAVGVLIADGFRSIGHAGSK